MNADFMRRAAGVAVALMIASAAHAEPSIERGHKTYNYWCATCHAPGNDFPGTLALGAKYKGALPAALEDRTDLNPEMVRYFVRNGISVMPFFRKTEVSDAELADIAAYLSRPRP
jgi:mono/diheme cytochrome c family protein